MTEPSSRYTPGGDAKAISRIANAFYGGFREMFDAHGWEAPGQELMTSAPALIVKHYGSVRQFEAALDERTRASTAPISDIWDRNYSVLFTSFWGWVPETWGTVGWTGDPGRARRENLLPTLTDPFITVCYVTRNKSHVDPALKGKVAGFYLVSHERGHRNRFSHPIHHGNHPEKWEHSLRALRAFSYLPEHRLNVADLYPAISSHARHVASMGVKITDQRQIGLLRNTPWLEVDVYTPGGELRVLTARPSHGLVPAGPASAQGYVVANGTQFLQRELYVLRLHGDTDAYLGSAADGCSIVKIGLAASPDLRRQALQKAMPQGAFRWKVYRTTLDSGLRPYPSFTVAERGEMAMKVHLAAHAKWLGGEFYLASEDVIESAWQAGCRAAGASE